MSNRPALVLIALATACAAGCGRMQSVAPHQAAERLATAARTALGRSAAPGTGKNDAREMAVQRQLADTQAQGRYKAAVARCAALGGETRRACAEEADAEYEIAEAKAQLATAQAPTPFPDRPGY